tara:strand:- start:96 stop:272 length:177 start_codon:yes stop_codon:yes gene_type:complete
VPATANKTSFCVVDIALQDKNSHLERLNLIKRLTVEFILTAPKSLFSIARYFLFISPT